MAEELRERLRYGTALHEFVVQAVKRRRDFSQQKMQERHERWRKADEAFLSYLPEKENDRIRKNLRTGGEPQFTTIYIPYDYAVLMSAHTYWTSVFLSRTPIFQFEGTNGGSESARLAIESLIGYQVRMGRMLPCLYTWLLDVGKYGAGLLGGFWDEGKIIVNREVEVEDEFLGVGMGTKRKEMRRVALPGYTGNKLYNISPFDALPDPRVTLGNLQQGEFFGRYTEISWNAIVRASLNGQYFNVDALRQTRSAGTMRDKGSPQVVRTVMPGEAQYREAMDMDFVDAVEMYVDLIPRDWGLDDSSFPEKWVFVLGNDNVLIAARPLGLIHNRFPAAAIEYEPDGYSLFKRGILEIAQPMTDTVNWLINTHFYNTRKALNDMFIVDPSRVVMKDLLDPRPGKVIRLKEEYYGSDVRTAISQLPVMNYTQQHLNDAQMFASLMQRVLGVNDSIMGMLSQGGRKTATEVRTSSTFGVNRLKTSAELFSATGFSDLGQLLLQQTQQLMDTPMKVRIAGELWNTPGAQNFVNVKPEDIQGFFDFSPVDGTLPVDKFALVNMWGQLMSQMANAPQVLAQYDLGKIFAYIAQLGGLRNVENFKIQLGSPEQLAQQAAAGNVIPIGGRGGQNSGRNAGAAGGTPVPAQIPGMGPSG